MIELEEMDGRCICQDCAAAIILSRTPNPSDENNKYEFDFRNRVWKLQKVKKPCVSCGTKRWLNASNQWKDKCKKCYLKTVSPAVSLGKGGWIGKG
ncbi:hypothetical protein [Paenibacillus taichungensis]|uniref:hypothetical protein n=1 Tax=Paenibacillus taichungensis TaxID=484184 RepID=UPI0035DE23BF